MVRREPSEGDGRGYYCTITEQGRGMRKRVRPAYRREGGVTT
jgi:DNA-binding MarR family transcriptional regulator